MLSALLRFLLGGSSGDEPITANANRIVQLLSARVARIMKSDRIIDVKEIERVVQTNQNRAIVADKNDRVTVAKDQRIIKVIE